jgi:hypothetical protein
MPTAPDEGRLVAAFPISDTELVHSGLNDLMV